MKITESKLRKMIRGVIREFTTTATAAGAEKRGYQSSDTRSKESDYDTKKSDYETKKSDYSTKLADRESTDSQRYRQAVKGGGYNYSSTRAAGFSLNPDWVTKDAAASTALRTRDSAETTKNTAKTTWDSAKAADLAKTVPTQKPPTGGRGGYGTGKTAGKGKGKKKK